jgi:malonate decarboxylase alpha subunit
VDISSATSYRSVSLRLRTLVRDAANEREQAIRGVAGFAPVGRGRDRKTVEALRRRGVIQRPEDLSIDPLAATRQLLAAHSIEDLVTWSGGLYHPPSKFRNW